MIKTACILLPDRRSSGYDTEVFHHVVGRGWRTWRQRVGTYCFLFECRPAATPLFVCFFGVDMVNSISFFMIWFFLFYIYYIILRNAWISRNFGNECSLLPFLYLDISKALKHRPHKVQAIRFWIAGTLPDVEGCSVSQCYFPTFTHVHTEKPKKEWIHYIIQHNATR